MDNHEYQWPRTAFQGDPEGSCMKCGLPRLHPVHEGYDFCWLYPVIIYWSTREFHFISKQEARRKRFFIE